MATAARLTAHAARQLAAPGCSTTAVLSLLFMLPAAAILLLSSSPIRSASASGWASPTPRSAGPACSSVLRTTFRCSMTTCSGCRSFNTLLYTVVATVAKFALGLWLALLLNNACRSRRSSAPSCCCPRSCRPCCRRSPSGGSTIRSSRSSPGRCRRAGLIDTYIDFLGVPWNARCVGDRRQRLARHPVRRHLPAGRAADDLAVALRGGGARRRQRLAALPARHRADADADPGGGADLLGAVHLHRFPADLRHHPRRAAELDASDGDARLPARHTGRRPRPGRGDRRRR